jgi:glucose/mannose-6-phosphate isomerase
VGAAGDPLGPEAVGRLDSQDQFGAIAAAADQLGAGRRAALEALEGASLADPRWASVAVCGMGGSAIGGDVAFVAFPELGVPAHVVRAYELPRWVTQHTLVVAVSYSGETEETISCLEQALARGCRPVCLTSGGTLASLADEHGLPVVPVPAGMQPRSALGLLTGSLVTVLERAGLITSAAGQLDEAAATLRGLTARLVPAVPEERNQAKQLARRLKGRIPVVYGAGCAAVAARRFKSELNEYADAVAFWAELPELDHNEFVAWSGVDPAAGLLQVVLLDDLGAAEPLRRRLALTRELVERRAAGIDVVTSEGSGPLARTLSLACVGDWTSLYLALLHGIDPGPVAVIEWLKRRMAGGDEAPPPAPAAGGGDGASA